MDIEEIVSKSAAEFIKPVNLLLEKISNAIGVCYEPYKAVRNARAEAEVQKINLLSKIECEAISKIASDQFQKNALARFIAEETKKQLNIENVIEKAIPQIGKTATPEEIENDWLFMFFDKVKFVSDDDMQNLWANVLAQEASIPGTFSKHSINILGSLSKRDALLFTALCSFTFIINNEPILLVGHIEEEVYKNLDITVSALMHLDDLGLIKYRPNAGFLFNTANEITTLEYFDSRYKIKLKNFNVQSNKFYLQYGWGRFTKAGEELSRICGAKFCPKILDYFMKFICPNIDLIEKN